MTNLVTDLIGRPTEVVEIASPYPYPTIMVTYRTIEEPIIMGDISYALEDSSFYKKGTMHPVENKDLQQALFEGLYNMVYKEELEKMTDYIIKNYPQYMQSTPTAAYLPRGVHVKQTLTIPNSTSPEERKLIIEKLDSSLERLFGYYKENMYRTKDEWKLILEVELSNIEYSHVLNIVSLDPLYIPNETDNKKIINDLFHNKYLLNINYFILSTYSHWYSVEENDVLQREYKTYKIPIDLEGGL